MEEQGPISQKAQDQFLEIKRSKRWIIFIFLALVSIFSNFDNGINPAATNEIKRDLGNISDSQLGLFGSADYIGRIISTIIIYAIIYKNIRKWILVFSLVLKAGTLYAVYITKNYWIILVIRGVSGFSQVFYTIYLPVWCDQYGSRKSRTMMISVIQLGCPLGIVMGFCLCSICKDWILSYAIEGALLVIMGIIISFIPNQFFSNTLIQLDDPEGLTFRECSEEEIEIKNQSSLMKNLGKILVLPVFMYASFANAVNYFGMGVLKFWTPDYMKNVLLVKDAKQITLAYSIISLTGPTLGVITGGIAGTFIGGYKTRKAIIVCIIFDICSCATGVPSSFVNNFFAFCALIWVFFFFSTALLPLETGIALAAVDEGSRGDASTVNNLILNAFGNLPPPFVYGLINDAVSKDYPKLALQSIFYLRLVGIAILIVGSIYRYRIPEEDNNNNSNVNCIKRIKPADNIEEDIKNSLIPNADVKLKQ